MTMSDALILYVDDESTNRTVFEHAFDDTYRVRTAASGAEALEILKRELVSVLVTDQRMPDMTGNALLQQVKQLYPDVIRLVVTAYSDVDPILRAINDGLVARYIIKPWDRRELEQILNWAVEVHRLGLENSALQLRLLQTERLVTLGSIGASVIHDINQPLAYLFANAERLRQLAVSAPALETLLAASSGTLDETDHKRLSDLAAELSDVARDMVDGCNVIGGLTGSIRRLLHPTSDAKVQVVDPMTVIRYALTVCRNVVMRARASLTYDGPAALPRVRMGSTELAQTLINLISNAASALSEQTNQPGQVVIRATDGGDTVRLVVQDNGPGMTEEVLKKVGTPFFSTRPDGTGLGVAQCVRLVGAAGGQLQIDSTPGKGTAVSLVLQKP